MRKKDLSLIARQVLFAKQLDQRQSSRLNAVYGNSLAINQKVKGLIEFIAQIKVECECEYANFEVFST